MSVGRPHWAKFNGGDWLRHPRLRTEQRRRQFDFAENVAPGDAPADVELANEIRADIRKFNRCLGEREAAKVFARDTAGLIYCKRMVEQAAAAKVLVPSDWQQLRAAVSDGNGLICTYCGDQDGPFECDHVVPRALGGGHEMENLTTACRACNRSKSDRPLHLWRPDTGSVQ